MRNQEPVSSQLKKLVIDLRLHGYPERLQGHSPELLEDVVVKLISQVEQMEKEAEKLKHGLTMRAPVKACEVCEGVYFPYFLCQDCRDPSIATWRECTTNPQLSLRLKALDQDVTEKAGSTISSSWVQKELNTMISQAEEMERTELTVSELIDHLMCQVEDLKKLIASKKLKNSKA